METIAIKGHLRGVDQYAYIGVLAPRLCTTFELRRTSNKHTSPAHGATDVIMRVHWDYLRVLLSSVSLQCDFVIT